MGLMLSGTVGFAHFNDEGHESRVGLRCFYIPLFNTSDESNATVHGGELEGHFSF